MTPDADMIIAAGGQTLWNTNSATERTVIVADAASQLDNADKPSGTYCNPYTAYWWAGSKCGNSNRSEAWCADFAAWVWNQANVPFYYGWSGGDIDAGAASFFEWAVANGTWHWAASGYKPQPGDVAVYGLTDGGTYADHVAIVLTPGRKGADVINGDWWSTGNGAVIAQDDETTATGADKLSGYASPLPTAHVRATIAAAPLGVTSTGSEVSTQARIATAPPAAIAAALARQLTADRASERLPSRPAPW
jgi:hypothetical protein